MREKVDNINMPYKTDIKKCWSWLEGKSLKLFTDYFLTLSQGTLIDEVIYYKKKLTHRQQGRIKGYADCLMSVDYMVNEDREQK